MKLKTLAGSGDKIGLLALPFLVIGIALNILYPPVFSVGGPPPVLAVISVVVLIPGAVGWLWSVVLILTKVPKKELITNGPYALMKHPLYTCVALLVLPWAGFLLNTWLGILLGAVIYVGSRLFSRGEEEALSRQFGKKWAKYAGRVVFKWL